MDRSPHRDTRRLAPIALTILLVAGDSGCSRLQKYRAQDSPLPGLPRLGRRFRGGSKAPADLARRDQPARGADVAWSGQPNDAPPAVALAAPPNARPDASRRVPSRPASAPTGEKAADPGLAQVRSLVDAGRAKLAKVGTYQVAMHRQERVGETLLPAEDVLLSIRREPRAVRLEWPAGPHKGREVIYSASNGGMMHINMADSVIPMPRMTMAPDSPMVLKNSRHPITEAGLDAVLDNLEASLKAHEAGAARGERFAYEGIDAPPEVGRTCHKITRSTAGGQRWIIAIDVETSLPSVVQETAANGELLEKYVFRNFAADPPALAEAAAFDPDGRWGAARGLFGRMAQGGHSASPAVH